MLFREIILEIFIYSINLLELLRIMIGREVSPIAAGINIRKSVSDPTRKHFIHYPRPSKKHSPVQKLNKSRPANSI